MEGFLMMYLEISTGTTAFAFGGHMIKSGPTRSYRVAVGSQHLGSVDLDLIC